MIAKCSAVHLRCSKTQGVVRRNDQNVVEPNGVLAPIAIDPRRFRLQDLGNKFADRLASSTEAL
jgi:hypothetical protein